MSDILVSLHGNRVGLDSSGALIIDGAAASYGANFGNGTAGAPTFAFSSDTDTGAFRVSSNILGFAANGVETARLGSAGAVFNNSVGDIDFTIKKLTSGSAAVYDAGADTWTLNGSTVGITGATTNTGAVTVTGGDVVLNSASGDYDFTVKKNTSGNAIAFNAGTVDLALNATTVGITGATTNTGAFTVTGATSRSVTNAITAFATGGQASAVALTADINSITVCATAADSVKLPAATAGRVVQVSNLGAAHAAVFPASGELIDALAANASVSLAVGGSIIFTCSVAGSWKAKDQVILPAKFGTGTTTTTFTAGQMTGAAWVSYASTAGTPGSIAFRTAALMFADDPYARVGGAYRLRISNTASGSATLTLTGGASGITLTGTATIADATYRDYLVTYTSATALVIQNIGSGTL
jgi:hypothetical protein